jgi:serine/threonine protein phosphatase PrpC
MLKALTSILPRFDFRAGFALSSDQGVRRDRYEDRALLAPELGVFGVADGMGGHQAGEIAAELAVQCVRRVLAGREAQRVVDGYVARADLVARRAVFACMRAAFEEANRLVREEAEKTPEHRGMGTTLDVVWLARDSAFVAHSGDGRVYLARPRAMVQLTQDHNNVTGRQSSSGRRAAGAGIANAIGLNAGVAVDTLFVDLGRGDRIVLCTDGIHGQIESEAELGEIARTGDAKGAADALVKRVSARGRDNATTIVVEVGERFVKRTDRDRGLAAADLERARQSPLLIDLPESFALTALSAAVEVEVPEGETIPRVVANDLVAYIVLDGVVRHSTSERSVGSGALIYPESLAGVTGYEAPPVAEQTARLLRLRADDFAELCRDSRLAGELYQRLAVHLARIGLRAGR